MTLLLRWRLELFELTLYAPLPLQRCGRYLVADLRRVTVTCCELAHVLTGGLLFKPTEFTALLIL